MADDMGYGDVNCFNPDSRIPTPNMDRVALGGTRCTAAHSPSAVCTPARYGVLTGRYCWRSWLKQGVVGGYTPPLIEKSRETIASLLARHGYRTGCVGKWHLGLGWTRRNGKVQAYHDLDALFPGSWQNGDPATGLDVDFNEQIQGGPADLGFDYSFYTASCSTMDGPFTFIENSRVCAIPDRPIFVDPSKEPEYGRPRAGLIAPGFSLETVDVDFTGKAIAFIEGSVQKKKPFFLYFTPSAPHTPWLPPAFVQKASNEGPRGDLVALFDWCVGEIARTLERLNIADNTLLVVTSDNGPHEGSNGHRSAGEWRGYKSHVWEGGHRIPLMARWPGRIKADSVQSEPFGLVDVMATCAAIAGADLPRGAAPDSCNVLPALLNSPHTGPCRRATLSHSVYGAFTIQRGPWKLIHECDNSGGWVTPRGTGPVTGSPGQLYNLDSDPGEQNNLFQREPQERDELIKLLGAYRDTEGFHS